MKTVLYCVALVAIGCGPSHRGGDDSMPTTHIEIEPADATATVINGVPVLENYTATLVTADGDRSDVTATASFSVADPTYGVWNGSSFSVNGGAAGPTQIIAHAGTTTGMTSLTVLVQGSRNDGTVPANIDTLFNSATETAGLAPTLAYPADGVTIPPNLGELDVHWQGSSADVFQVEMKNEYVDLKIYKQGSGPVYTNYLATEWYSLASTHSELTLTVSGMVSANPAQKGTSTPQKVEVTNETIAGGMYYWTTEPTQGVLRYDMSTPDIAPASFFAGATSQPTTCVGCHALSRDGTKMALTLDSGNGRGTIYDVASYTVMVPFDSNAQSWNFATFTPDAAEVLTVFEGAMSLRTTNGGTVIAAVPSNAGYVATHPELSPDGTHLANVETTSDFYDFQVSDGSIVTRTFDQTTNTFGAITTLVPNAAGASNYYPSWSPDGQWIAFTRTGGNSYADASAEVWVVKADGTLPPIQLALADSQTGSIENSWARWAPFPQTYGANEEPLFYLTFSSVRGFGVRTSSPTSLPQLWMTPFFPDRALAGTDPSGPAFRMPFQDLMTGNHIAQWTDAVVIARKADGTPLTQAEAVATGVMKPNR